MQSPTWSGAPAAARPLPGGAALPAQPRAQETPTWLPALARPRPPLNDAEAPGRRAIPNWSACPAPSPRQLPTPDTVNAPEFPIMYLFWVFILCTEMAAHMCFLRKRKKKKKPHNGKEETIPLHFWFFAVLACVPEGTRFLALGTCAPVAQVPQLESTPSPARHLGQKALQVQAGPQGPSGGCPLHLPGAPGSGFWAKSWTPSWRVGDLWLHAVTPAISHHLFPWSRLPGHEQESPGVTRTSMWTLSCPVLVELRAVGFPLHRAMGGGGWAVKPQDSGELCLGAEPWAAQPPGTDPSPVRGPPRTGHPLTFK